MAKKLRKPKKILIEPYGAGVEIHTRAGDLIRYYQNTIGVDFSDGVYGAAGWVNIIEETDTGRRTMICLLSPEYDEETVWHEALHLAIFALDHAGVAFDAQNHEALTYLQGHIVRQIKKKIYPSSSVGAY